MDNYVQDWGFSIWNGYNWCVPRGTYDSNGVVDYVWPEDHPVQVGDEWASFVPIMSDVILKNNTTAPDLSDGLPAAYNFDGFYSNPPVTYGTHIKDEQITDANLLFADGHVEVHMPGQIKNRYGYSAWNMY